MLMRKAQPPAWKERNQKKLIDDEPTYKKLNHQPSHLQRSWSPINSLWSRSSQKPWNKSDLLSGSETPTWNTLEIIKCLWEVQSTIKQRSSETSQSMSSTTNPTVPKNNQQRAQLPTKQLLKNSSNLTASEELHQSNSWRTWLPIQHYLKNSTTIVTAYEELNQSSTANLNLIRSFWRVHPLPEYPKSS